MDNGYEYTIGVHRLSPTIGLYNYVAKVIWLAKVESEEEAVEYIEPNMGEYIGVTQTEAITQAEKAVRSWIASHN